MVRHNLSLRRNPSSIAPPLNKIPTTPLKSHVPTHVAFLCGDHSEDGRRNRSEHNRRATPEKQNNLSTSLVIAFVLRRACVCVCVAVPQSSRGWHSAASTDKTRSE